MATQVLRPDATVSGASNYTVTGGTTVHGVTSDNSDTTYVRKSGTGTKSAIVTFGNYTVNSAETIKRVRLRARTSTPTSSGKVNLQLGANISGSNYYFPALGIRGTTTLGEVTGAWQTAAPDGASWDQSRLNALRCQLTEYRDSTDRGYVYELYVDVDLASRPTLTVDSPTGTVTTTAKPEIAWTYSDTDGEAQTYYEIKIFSAAQYGAGGFDPSTSTPTWTSGVVSSTEGTAQVGTFLTSATYRAYVRVAKTVNAAAFFSDWAYSAFTLSLTPPPTPTVTTSYSSTTNAVTAVVDGATSGTYTYQRLDLQRSDDAGTTWTDVRLGTDVIPDGNFDATIVDYEAKRGQTAYYRARSVGYVGENVVASAWSTSSSIAIANDGTWWLKAITSSALNRGSVRILANLDIKQEEDLGVFRPIGRSKSVVIAGTIGGQDGSYSIATFGDSEWAAIYGLISHQGTLLVQAPDSTQKYVRITDRSWTEKGAVGSLIRELKVSYVEVDA